MLIKGSPFGFVDGGFYQSSYRLPVQNAKSAKGYYRCSTSKGCSAKKQVERCRTDASMLIITYTCSHNHPGPDLATTNLTQQAKEHQTPLPEDHPTTPKEEQKQEQQTLIKVEGEASEDHFHYSKSPFNTSQDITINQEENLDLENTYDSPSVLFDTEPLSYPQLMTFTAPKSEENDFYDELEELPSSSFFSSFIMSNFFEEMILVHPS
ncbi:unnamed protein product [Ilex paraguariensis]|uniref:WRKY domain-containing protein n=1 Tax=Ilex paraguariensis TaxID=185542 RepID=A0ABC8RQB3_9AQUA